MPGYVSRFNQVSRFFEGRLEQGQAGSAELIRRLGAIPLADFPAP